ncbi:hypothetical protein JYB64_08655 [Algoriphagus aestuarii]|nr:hypothetical protein [Algoriphagus aestuarii]
MIDHRIKVVPLKLREKASTTKPQEINYVNGNKGAVFGKACSKEKLFPNSII